ncbi:uncharacterized protein [Prorops nasuta]|uniref:uncharacterized protein isoform X2 n=1 Tax=Prorops nasuta TaxID=863751 RepID=UPI0034CE6145
MPQNLNSSSVNFANPAANQLQPYPYRANQHGDGLQPEKEPLDFDTSHLRGAPTEVENLVHNIKDVAQQFLYHWKTFPIILPTPISSMCTEGEDTLARKKHYLRDLFVAPSFDELDAVAVDTKGEPRRLTNKQLESIRERGEFEVDSINFTGQTHRWRLSGLLQRGRNRRRETLLNDLALATRFLVVTAKARLASPCFSISESFKALLTGLLRLVDILIGLPSLQAHNLDGKIREERSRYLVAELICRPEYEDSLERLGTFIRKQLRRAIMEKFEVEREFSQLLQLYPIPFVFDTPGGAAVDLRLFSRDVIRKALPDLISILDVETRGWFLHFKERLISELKAQKKLDEEIEKEVNEAVMREYLQRVYTHILSFPDILLLGEGIDKLLVQQAQSVVLMYRAVQNVQQKLMRTKESLRHYIENKHPVLSRIEPWMRDRMRETEEKFIQEYEWSAHEEALKLCSEQNLHQTIYFLNRDLKFMKEREPVLLKELRKVKSPTRSFQWPIQIWFPKNWIVRRNFQGQSEIIPTVLSNMPTTITTPRADPTQPVFLVEREIVYTTTTRWPFWRWINYIARTWCWTWNAMFLFGVAVPWCSPISFRALLLVQPFTPDLELSQLNGTLFPRKSSQTPTLCSRLITLWRHISKSRTHFETEPDTGFIGKGMTRHINRLWNYGAKGLLGTLIILFIFPVVCIVASLSSFIIALTAIMWMPFVTLSLHAFMGLFIDLDSPEQSRNRTLVMMETLIWNIGIQGFLQPLAALIVAVIFCPIIFLIILTVAVVRYWTGVMWDTTMFHLVIKSRGRIPASDSFIVKRIAGPGLASDYYYQIKPEQALAAFEAKLELDELLAFQQETERLITQPQRDFTQFIEACFGPFAASLAKNKDPYKSLEKEAKELIGVLQEKIDRRRKNLQTGLATTIKTKIKLTTFDLKVVIQQGALMLERLYPSHVFARLSNNEENFWDAKSLDPGDWAGLAGLMYADIFSLDFLQPLDDTDTKFKLDPHPSVDLSRYTDMVHSTELGGLNGPDLLGAVYTPRGNIQIHSPYLEVSAFNPRAKQVTNSKKSDKRCENSGLLTSSKIKKCTMSSNCSGENPWQPWKRQACPYNADKLVIPLPIPHPARIAITIYNRDSEEPIPLDSEVCQNILRAIEELPGEILPEYVNRYRCAGDSSFDSVASQPSGSIDAGLDKVNEVKEEKEATKDGEPYQWTLSNWGGAAARRRKNSGSIKVDLASPEDVTLDTDTTKVMFSTYGTTV